MRILQQNPPATKTGTHYCFYPHNPLGCVKDQKPSNHHPLPATQHPRLNSLTECHKGVFNNQDKSVCLDLVQGKESRKPQITREKGGREGVKQGMHQTRERTNTLLHNTGHVHSLKVSSNRGDPSSNVNETL